MRPTLFWCLFALTLAACGHGPPERMITIDDYATPPGGAVTIAVRSFSVSRPARGLSKIPDGGIAIPIDDGFEALACDTSTRTFRPILTRHIKTNDFISMSIAAWRNDAVVITRGRADSTIVPLQPSLHVRATERNPMARDVLPACKTAFDSLRRLSDTVETLR